MTLRDLVFAAAAVVWGREAVPYAAGLTEAYAAVAGFVLCAAAVLPPPALRRRPCTAACSASCCCPSPAPSPYSPRPGSRALGTAGPHTAPRETADDRGNGAAHRVRGDCRYHYVLDAVAGMATASLALALTSWFTDTAAAADRRRSGQ